MTTLGHIIIGATIGMLSLPPMQTRRRFYLYLIAIIAVANIPDWPLPGWGHHRLTFSHSLFVNGVAMTGILIALVRFEGGSFVRQYRVFITGCIAAWLSHFLLDTLYVDSSLYMLWPFSRAGISLPIPWLRTMPHVPPPFDRQILQIFLMELLTFSPFLIMALVIRKTLQNR